MTVYAMVAYGLVLNLLGSLARGMDLQQYVDATILLPGLLLVFFGCVQAALPSFGRRTVFFSVTVPDDFGQSTEAGSIARRYRHLVLVLTLITVALTWVNFVRIVPGSIWAAAAIFASGAVWAYARARAEARRFAVSPSAEREAPLATPTNDVRQTYRAIAVSALPALVAGLFILLERSHFPDKGAFERGFGVNGAVWFGLALIAVAILHGSRRAGALRKVNLTATIAFMWVCSAAPAAFTVLRWFNPREQFSGWSFSLVTLLSILGIAIWRLRAALRLRDSMDLTPDDCWKLGRFYYNKQDPAFLTERRVGLGYTFNFARKITWFLAAVLCLLPMLAVLPLVLPATGQARAGARAMRLRKAITVDASVLDRYTGQYQLARQFIINVTRDGDHLYAQATGQGRFELFPEAEDRYFATVANIVISFDHAANGKATGLMLQQGRTNATAKRLEDAAR